RRKVRLASASHNQRDIVRLFVGADPIVDRRSYNFCNAMQRQMLVLPDQVDKALLAELTEVVLRLSDSIAIGEENIARYQLSGPLIERQTVEKPNYHSSFFETAHRAVSADDHRRQMTAVAIGNGT